VSTDSAAGKKIAGLTGVPPDVSQAPAFPKLDRPVETTPLRLFWPYFISLSLVHGLGLLAFFPAFYSTSGLVVGIITHCLFDGLGVSIGYHRLLTHRGFQCPRWLEHLFAILGICTLQDSPARWVAIHRMHHQFSDHQPDPHSPLVTFFWGHMEWLLVKDRRHDNVYHFERYVRDLLRDPFYLRLEKNLLWMWVYVLHALLIYVAGIVFGLAIGLGWSAAVGLGVSWLVWGVIVRTIFTLHVTWAVNSVAHRWGYRNYDTKDNSRNSWWVALFTFGEGWHNNHHADQRSARHGHTWWEYDVSWWIIRSLERVGLATNVIGPRVSPKSRNNELDEITGGKLE
jgi:stearoyl-CoA desaturase (delta-9 desaturase)